MKKSYFKKDEDPDVQISKALTYYLRHGAEKEGLPIRPDGFVSVDILLEMPKFKSKKLSYEKLKEIVDKNDKKRFELANFPDLETKYSRLFIRATQGHTMTVVEDELLLTKIEDCISFQTVVHGSFMKFWDDIKKQGLKTMKRNHIHFAPGYPGEKEVISGMRSNCSLLIEIDMEKAMKDGMVFYLSKNNVILTSGFDKVIPPKYFKQVKDQNNKILFENKGSIENEEEKKSEEVKIKNEPLDYLLVLDFEAQCDEKDGRKLNLEIQEIIEFPVVPINLKTGVIEKDLIFHYYIKPVKLPILTEFCQGLTGIKQEQVDQGIILEEALELLHNHLTKSGILNKNWCFVTCGDWDLQTCLKSECKKKEIPLKKYMKRWINIKKIFRKEFEVSSKSFGMPYMLEYFKLKLEGNHHSGIDDSKNISQIALKFIEKGVKFNQFIQEYI